MPIFKAADQTVVDCYTLPNSGAPTILDLFDSYQEAWKAASEGRTSPSSRSTVPTLLRMASWTPLTSRSSCRTPWNSLGVSKLENNINAVYSISQHICQPPPSDWRQDQKLCQGLEHGRRSEGGCVEKIRWAKAHPPEASKPAPRFPGCLCNILKVLSLNLWVVLQVDMLAIALDAREEGHLMCAIPVFQLDMERVYQWFCLVSSCLKVNDQKLELCDSLGGMAEDYVFYAESDSRALTSCASYFRLNSHYCGAPPHNWSSAGVKMWSPRHTCHGWKPGKLKMLQWNGRNMIVADFFEGFWSCHGMAAKTSCVQCWVFGWLTGWMWMPDCQFYSGAKHNSEASANACDIAQLCTITWPMTNSC